MAEMAAATVGCGAEGGADGGVDGDMNGSRGGGGAGVRGDWAEWL